MKPTIQKLRFLILILLPILILSGCEPTSSGSSEGDQDIVKVNPPPKLTASVMAKVRTNGVYGYIDTLGNFIIQPQYPMAKSFSQGLAAVNIGGLRKPGLTGVEGGIYEFINPAGTQVTNNFMTVAEGFNYGVAIFLEGTNQKGFINTKGEVVATGFDVLMPFSDSLAIAAKVNENTFGYVNTFGEWVLKVNQEDVLGDFNSGLAFKVENGKYGFIDRTGTYKIPAKFELANNFSEGLAMFKKGERFGYLNTEGKIAIPATFESVGSFKNGYAGVRKGEKWGYIDQSGNTIVDFRFDNVRSFNQGIAAVLVGGKVGYVTLDGRWLVEPRFTDGSDFSNGHAAVKENGKIGYINTQGTMVITPQYEVGGTFVTVKEETDPRLF